MISGLPSTNAFGLMLAERNAANAHGDAARERKAALKQQQIRRRQNRAIADVEVVAALDRKARDAVAVDEIGTVIALRVEAALGDGDQGTCERRTGRRHRQAFQALVEFEGLKVGRHLDRYAARGEAILGVIEAHDFFHALDADIERAVGIRERLGVEPAARGERFAIGPEHRRHLGIGDGCRPAVVVHDTPTQPGAVVGQSQKMAAIGLDVQSGNAAERFVGRGEREAAAEFQGAEAHPRRIAIVEGGDWRRFNRNGRKRLAIARSGQRISAGCDQQRRQDEAGDSGSAF